VQWWFQIFFLALYQITYLRNWFGQSISLTFYYIQFPAFANNKNYPHLRIFVVTERRRRSNNVLQKHSPNRRGGSGWSWSLNVPKNDNRISTSQKTIIEVLNKTLLILHLYTQRPHIVVYFTCRRLTFSCRRWQQGQGRARYWQLSARHPTWNQAAPQLAAVVPAAAKKRPQRHRGHPGKCRQHSGPQGVSRHLFCFPHCRHHGDKRKYNTKFRSGIRKPKSEILKNLFRIPDQKDTGSRIRIRNTAPVHKKTDSIWSAKLDWESGSESASASRQAKIVPKKEKKKKFNVWRTLTSFVRD